MKEWTVYAVSAAAAAGAAFRNTDGYRPFQWALQPQLTYLRQQGSTTAYYFDAIIRAEHTSALRITEHPVQNGANITDHAFSLPARLALDIGMSDAMGSFVQGQWSGDSPKSVTAYQVLRKLQDDRLPLAVVTRLAAYENMLIEQIAAPDDARTLYGLRATVTLRQIIMAQVSIKKVSVRPDATTAPGTRPVQAKPVEEDRASLLRRIEDRALGWLLGRGTQ